jgi:hypothetical protein
LQSAGVANGATVAVTDGDELHMAGRRTDQLAMLDPEQR